MNELAIFIGWFLIFTFSLAGTCALVAFVVSFLIQKIYNHVFNIQTCLYILVKFRDPKHRRKISIDAAKWYEGIHKNNDIDDDWNEDDWDDESPPSGGVS